MRTLVDGYNLLWAFPQLRELMLAGRPELAREGLMALLAGLLRSGRLQAPVTVVFDGSPGAPRPPGDAGGALDARFAPHPSTADELICEMIEGSSDPAGITVVSSDREVRSRSARAGAHVIRTGEFIETHLPASARTPRKETPRPRGVPGDPEKPPPPASDIEVERWLREFGLEE